MDFRESDCYKQALHLCSQGSAILTELLRLSNYIPDVFLLQRVKNDPNKFQLGSGKPLDRSGELKYSEQMKYLKILFDLEYVKDQDKFDMQI